ncbi:YihY/virulence factor BrkB family protein [Terriglobus tenax]|uniref:YihY/virulence factor BrkB family protein n=1 Tax=Terriglobus tenax TaxID=1111115 RepID=UPI0021E03854|nr:YihY/virulence factor BrkB family protein [Terriglobus tenax]
MPSILPSNEERRDATTMSAGELAERPAVLEAGSWPQIKALLKYLTKTEVHTYAFSVAAQVILSLFPFIVLMLTLSRRLFHSRAMEDVVGDMMHNLLPVGQDFIVRNMQILAHPHKGAQLFSVFMLLVTSTGVFLPLEVALNNVWGVKENRSYLHNQVVSLGLAGAVGVLAMASVAGTAAQQKLLSWIFFGHTENWVYRFFSHTVLEILSIIAGILLFFLIYWLLPNRKIPAMAVLPTAIVVGLLWQIAKVIYVKALPLLDFQGVYGPFYISVGLMTWAFLSGLLLLAGGHFSANRHAVRMARIVERKEAVKDAA